MKNFLLALTLVITWTGNAQTVGYMFGMNGNEIDQFINFENRTFSDITSNINTFYDYLPGTVYFTNNEVEFFPKLKIDNSGIKNGARVTPGYMNLEKIEKVVLAGDTIVIIPDTLVTKKSIVKKYYPVTFIDESKFYELYTRKKTNNTKYYIKSKNTGKWYDITSFDNRRKHFINKYQHIPMIVKLSQSTTTTLEVKKLFKIVKYYELYSDKKKLFFDDMNQVITDSSRATSYARIQNVTAKYWQFSFHQIDGTKTAQMTFSSIFPFKKAGLCVWYYPNGNKRKEANFNDDELNGFIMNYNHDGSKHSTFKLTSKGKQKYNEIYEGGEVKNAKDVKAVSYYDYINDRQLILKLNRSVLKEVFYNDKISLKLIYLLADYPAKVTTLKYLQYPYEAKKQGLTGIVRFKIRLDRHGYIKDYEILNEPNEIFRIWAEDYISDPSKLSFKAASDHNAIKVASEFIFAVKFDISGTLKNNNNSWMIHNHMMFHQNMMMHSIPANIPSRPGF